MKETTLLRFFNTEILPLVDELDHDKENCLICKSIDRAIKYPSLESITALATIEATKRGFDVTDHLKTLDELEHTAPFGRCSECNLALTETEMHLYGDMHQNCAEDHCE